MKMGWQEKRFEDCLEKVIYTNKIQRKDFLKQGKFPVISQEQDFINGYWNNSSDLFIIKKPIIVFGDHTKIVKYVDFDFVLGADGVKILQPIDNFNPKYFYYYLRSIEFENLGYARHYRLFKDISVPLPPLSEQRRIVSSLDEAFAAIAKAKDNTEKNLRNLREFYQSFLNSAFTDPENNWEEIRLGDYCQIDSKRNNQKNLPFVGMEDIDGNTHKFIGPNEPRKGKSSSFSFSNQHLLYGRLRPYLNKVILPNFSGHCSTEILPIKTNKLLSREFLFYWFISDQIVSRINKTSTGARMPRANMREVLNFNFLLPPLPEQKRIIAKLNMLSVETQKLDIIYRQKLVNLEELKKSILKKAFEGELIGL